MVKVAVLHHLENRIRTIRIDTREAQNQSPSLKEIANQISLITMILIALNYVSHRKVIKELYQALLIPPWRIVGPNQSIHYKQSITLLHRKASMMKTSVSILSNLYRQGKGM